jgi:hypothetical protein
MVGIAVDGVFDGGGVDIEVGGAADSKMEKSASSQGSVELAAVSCCDVGWTGVDGLLAGEVGNASLVSVDVGAVSEVSGLWAEMKSCIPSFGTFALKSVDVGATFDFSGVDCAGCGDFFLSILGPIGPCSTLGGTYLSTLNSAEVGDTVP